MRGAWPHGLSGWQATLPVSKPKSSKSPPSLPSSYLKVPDWHVAKARISSHSRLYHQIRVLLTLYTNYRQWLLDFTASPCIANSPSERVCVCDTLNGRGENIIIRAISDFCARKAVSLEVVRFLRERSCGWKYFEKIQYLSNDRDHFYH